MEGQRRRLYCRLATNKDQKKHTCDGRSSKYYNWVINKQKLGTYVKKQAHHEIAKAYKTKNINRESHHHRTAGQVKREAKKEEEGDSSSGVDDSEDIKAE